jgi:hypothetical protein
MKWTSNFLSIFKLTLTLTFIFIFSFVITLNKIFKSKVKINLLHIYLLMKVKAFSNELKKIKMIESFDYNIDKLDVKYKIK